MTLVLEIVEQTAVPIEVEGLIPSALRDKGLDEIARLPIAVGNQTLPAGELFRISGNAADERIEMRGDLSGVHWIGAKMDRGEIRVLGPSGRHVGSEMSGGEISVDGDVGDYLGGQMQGGLIRVRGQAGHLVGAAYRGSPRGMTGGTILVHGRAGNEIGLGMRRGLIAVGGAEDAVGFNMLAGTILVFGPCGMRPGAGMRRGTLGLFGQDRPSLLPTFRFACRLRLLIRAMLFRELDRLAFPVPPSLRDVELDMFHGDFVALGRGEVFLVARD